MSGAIDFASDIARSWQTSIFAFAAFTGFELLTQRDAQSLKGRLPGLVFWAIWLPVSMWVHAGFAATWRAIGIEPLVTLPMQWSVHGVVAAFGAAVLAAMVYDFFFYWCHRFEHRYLWRFHAVHHSIRELNTVNAFHHVTEPVIQSLLILLPLSLLVCDVGAVPLAAIVVLFLQASFIHSPSRYHLGPLSRVIVDNRFHRIHHSLDERHFDRNFGAMTTLWDHLFGTATVPRGDEWPDVGIDGVEPPRSVRDWLAFPWRRTPARPGDDHAATHSPGI